MLDISKLISDFIVAQWLEDDPDDDDIAFTFDEFNPNNPKIQMLFENGTDKKVWITRNIYRVEHSCKLSIFVRPVNYMPLTIDAAKATFLAIKIEVDRILNLKFGITGIQATELGGWKDIDFEVGRDAKGKTGKEPITFVAEQVIRTIYYEGEFA
jgi:hypothetical protein